MELLNQTQVCDDYRYKITDLIEASKNIDVFYVKVKDMYLGYESPCFNTLLSFIEHMKHVEKADLKYPIILSPENVILDGKHRLAKAILLSKERIKAVRFKEMPDCGEYIGE